MTHQIRRQIDPFNLLMTVLDWLGRVLTVSWLARQLQTVLDSRRLLFFAMRLVYRRSHLPFRLSVRLPGGSELGLPWCDYFIANKLYLRLALKYEPMMWYDQDCLFPWYLDWGEPPGISTMSDLGTLLMLPLMGFP